MRNTYVPLLAPVRAKYSADEMSDMADKGQAMKNPSGDPSYPINDEEDLRKAIKAVGRGSADHDAIRAHVIKRAKALGLSSMIPDNWNADGSLADAASATPPPDWQPRADGLGFGTVWRALDGTVGVAGCAVIDLDNEHVVYAARSGDLSTLMRAGYRVTPHSVSIDPPALVAFRADEGEPEVRAADGASTTHPPFTGNHTHSHTAAGSQGEDDTHSHAHAHDGDAAHDHAHEDDGDGEDNGENEDGEDEGEGDNGNGKGKRSLSSLAATHPSGVSVAIGYSDVIAEVEAEMANRAEFDGLRGNRGKRTRALRALRIGNFERTASALTNGKLRDGDLGPASTFEGIASTVGNWYDVRDFMGVYQEKITPGAFAKTIRDGSNVPLLFNHDGIPLASTGADTLRLAEIKAGLATEADLDRRSTYTDAIALALDRRDLQHMSFSFRAVEDEWNDDYSTREVGQLDLFDVSVVVHPANGMTSAALRSAAALVFGPPRSARRRALSGVLTEARAGRTLSANNQALLERALDAIDSVDDAIGAAMEAIMGADEDVDDAQDALQSALSSANANGNGNDSGPATANQDGTEVTPQAVNALGTMDGAGPRSAMPDFDQDFRVLEMLKARGLRRGLRHISHS